MQALLKKLNYKQEEAVHLFYVPEELRELPALLSGHAEVINNLEDHNKPVRFALLFATQQAVLDAAVHALIGQLEGDAILWICYPKGSSKRYRCDFNRDTGWQVCGQYNLEPVRQVAVNEDWSALRFRKTQYIKQLTRSSDMALGAEAKARLSEHQKA
jgi:hypothetical protein